MQKKTNTSGPRLKCKKCGDIIQSFHVHDFKFCKCKAVAIDGGSDYTRVTGSSEDFEFFEEEVDDNRN